METMHIFLQNMAEVMKSLSHFLEFKVWFAILFSLAIYMVGQEHLPLIGALTMLVVIDWLTGVYQAYKNGDHITSAKMVKTAIKWTLYMLMLSAAHLTDILIPGDWVIQQATLAFLGATELVSILENVGRAGVAIPLKLLNRLEEFRRTK